MPFSYLILYSVSLCILSDTCYSHCLADCRFFLGINLLIITKQLQCTYPQHCIIIFCCSFIHLLRLCDHQPIHYVLVDIYLSIYSFIYYFSLICKHWSIQEHTMSSPSSWRRLTPALTLSTCVPWTLTPSHIRFGCLASSVPLVRLTVDSYANTCVT